MNPEISAIFEKLEGVKILVVGDVMLDRYWWGTMTRISPEAPVPIVNLEKESFVVGGAANVAANIKGLGATPYLVGIIGDDVNGEDLVRSLETARISSNALVKSKDRPTTTKTRIVAHHQQIARIDHELAAEISDIEEEMVLEKCLDLVNEVDLIVVSDYLKGLATDNLLSRLITTANLSDKRIIVDPKGTDYLKYKNSSILTPNRKEAFEASRKREIQEAGAWLLTELNLESLLITQGEEGMTIFEKEKDSFSLSSQARRVYDVTGAGDTVIATLSTFLAAGGDLKTAAWIANVAAGCVVEEIGTTVIDTERLREELVL